MNLLTNHANGLILSHAAPHGQYGVESPYSSGAEVMRRQVHSFFYALTVMVGGVLGGCEACRTQSPVSQPDTSSATLSLRAPVGGLKPLLWSHPMNTKVTPNFRPYVEVINGQIKTTSLKIAEHFGKRHDNVIRAIKRLDCSPEFRALNFEETHKERENPSGGLPIKTPVYEITRDGFTFLAMGFTGKEAAKWKESYINAFNKLAEEVHRPQYGLKQLPDFTREVEAALERRAQELSLRQYEYIKQQLRTAIKKFGSDLNGKKLVEFIQYIDLPDSKLVIVHRDELWKLTSSVASMALIHRLAMDNVHELEARTGAEWYGRPDNNLKSQ